MDVATVAQGEVIVELIKANILCSEDVGSRRHAKEGLPGVNVCRISRDHRWPRERSKTQLIIGDACSPLCIHPSNSVHTLKALPAMIGSAYTSMILTLKCWDGDRARNRLSDKSEACGQSVGRSLDAVVVLRCTGRMFSVCLPKLVASAAVVVR